MKNLEALQAQYKTTRRILWVYPVIILIVIALLFVNRYVALALLGVSLLLQLFVFRRLQKGYQNDMANAIVEHTVCQKLDGAPLDAMSGGAITPDVVKRARLLPFTDEKGACLLRMGITGKDISLCDATLLQRFQLVKKGKSRVHFVNGCYFSAKLAADTHCDFQIVDKDLMPTPVRVEFYSQRLEADESEVQGLDAERYFAYKSLDSAPLPEGFIKQVMLLADYTPGKLGISLRGDVLTVFLRDRFLARPVSMATAPTQEMLDFDPMPELAYVQRMANAAKPKALNS